jgi:predicted ATPase
MLTALLGTDQVQDDLVDLVLDKTEGVPFFIEELVQSLREAGAIVCQDGQWTLTAEASVLKVPDTIQMGQESGGFQHEVSQFFANAAGYLLRLGRYREAFEHCHQALTASLKAGNKKVYGCAYMVLAEVHTSEDYRDWDKATWYLEESLKAFREVGAQIDLGRAYLAGGRIAVERQDNNAHQWAEQARDIFAECGASALLKEAEELLEELS